MGRESVMGVFSVGEIRTGLWCPSCRLPSVVGYAVHLLSELGVGTPIWCAKCSDCKLGFPIGRCL